ncbi:MAG: signal peptidase II [Candidatus Kerfeldbacteria bacterium]
MNLEVNNIRRSYAIMTGVLILLFIADRLTKYWAKDVLEGVITPIPRVLEFDFVFNESFVMNVTLPLMLTIAIIVAVIVFMVAVAARELHNGHHAHVMLLAVILLGAFSNLIDRIRYGAVMDFISVPGLTVFNLADAYIVIAAVLLLLVMQSEKKKLDTAPE